MEKSPAYPFFPLAFLRISVVLSSMLDVGPTPPTVEKSSTMDPEPQSKNGFGMAVGEAESDSEAGEEPKQVAVPLKWKLASILMVSAIGFGSQWSSGITGAMKSTLKKELKINNTQYALLDASEDFMVTLLMLVSGVVTDRIGGAGISSPPLTQWLPC